MININEKIMVSVWMIAYNHEKYIGEAIEGVLLQKTNFNIELVIGDDCSTDDTVAIIKEYQKKYPNLIKARFNSSNMGMTPNALKTFEECTGKYIAMCEGDDYWTDPLKLQKQVDFLENNDDYVSCFHNSLELIENAPEKSINYCSFNESRTFCFDDLLYSNIMPTQSVVFRRIFDFKPYANELEKSKFLDWYLHLLNAQNGKVWYINEVMGVHRITQVSVWSPLSKTIQLKSIIETYNLYKITFRDYKNLLSNIQKNYIIQYLRGVNNERNIMEFGYAIKTIFKYYSVKYIFELFIRKYIKRKKKGIKLNEYINYHASTILLNGISLRFDVGKEPRKYVEIGEKGLISANFIFESSKGYVKIGNNVHIGGAMLISRSSITIGNDVTMAWGIMIYDHDSHSIHWGYRKYDNHQCYTDYFNHNGNNVANKDWTHVVSKPIVICDKVWIGFDVTILKGVTIGEGAVIGAKSVVTKDVPAWTVVAGNPAKVVKEISESFKK